MDNKSSLKLGIVIYYSYIYSMSNTNYFNKAIIKGKIGEDIVRDFLQSKGVMIYAPTVDDAHCVDFVCHHIGKKHEWWLAEVKTKPKQSYSNTTGFNLPHFKDYCKMLEQGLDTYVFFVDVTTKSVYGKRISKLKELPSSTFTVKGTFSEIIVWNVDLMDTVFKLTEENIKQINNIKL